MPIIVRACLFGAVPERPFAPWGEKRRLSDPCLRMLAARLSRLPRERVCGFDVAVAADPRARLLGLAGLPREGVGEGLLIPGCASVHTFGMRFDLDLVFLDRSGRPLEIHRRLRACRLVWCLGARAVLEVPAW